MWARYTFNTIAIFDDRVQKVLSSYCVNKNTAPSLEDYVSHIECILPGS